MVDHSDGCPRYIEISLTPKEWQQFELEDNSLSKDQLKKCPSSVEYVKGRSSDCIHVQKQRNQIHTNEFSVYNSNISKPSIQYFDHKIETMLESKSDRRSDTKSHSHQGIRVFTFQFCSMFMWSLG